MHDHDFKSESPRVPTSSAMKNSPTSFLRKCLTVLIGIGLSWATVTNSEMQKVAESFAGSSNNNSVADPDMMLATPLTLTEAVGDEEPSVVCDDVRCWIQPKEPLTDSGLEPLELVNSVSTMPTSSLAPKAPVAGLASSNGVQSGTPKEQIDAISNELKRLGVTYLRLERLTNPDHESYRVRCDMAGEAIPVKCCYEATRATALAAMQDVLHAVREQSRVEPRAIKSTST